MRNVKNILKVPRPRIAGFFRWVNARRYGVNNGETALFPHVLKCAGHATYSTVATACPWGTVHLPYKPPHENVLEIVSLSEKERQCIRAVCAHMPNGAHRYFRNAKYFKILREPVARVVSSYYHSMNSKQDPFGKRNREKIYPYVISRGCHRWSMFRPGG